MTALVNVVAVIIVVKICFYLSDGSNIKRLTLKNIFSPTIEEMHLLNAA